MCLQVCIKSMSPNRWPRGWMNYQVTTATKIWSIIPPSMLLEATATCPHCLCQPIASAYAIAWWHRYKRSKLVGRRAQAIHNWIKTMKAFIAIENDWVKLTHSVMKGEALRASFGRGKPSNAAMSLARLGSGGVVGFQVQRRLNMI